MAPAQLDIYNPTVGSPAYPVPEPVASTLPVAGFRTRASLQTRLADLALASDAVSRHQVGATLEGEPIHAFVLGDGDDIAVDGTPEPGALVNGAIHAREWCSPEIATRLIEWFVANDGVDPIGSYLLAQNRLVVLPLLNIDGLDQTQRFWDRDFADIDGRMRRKNMRVQGGGTVDHNLNTTGDNRLGTDLNRQFPVGFGGPFSSSTATSDTYRGPSALAEPEAVALADAIGLFQSPAQLRFYADVHGAIPALYVNFHGTEAADLATYDLGQRMRAVYNTLNGRSISMLYVCPASGDCVADDLGIGPGLVDPPTGATDEYHAFTYAIPSFTIEYPTPNYRDFGSGPTFILPADEVAQTVEENRQALLLAFYFAAGPPIVERVRVWGDADADGAIDDGEIVHDSSWAADTPNTARVRTVAQDDPLVAGLAYRVVVQFNKPMRPMSGPNAIQWTGQSVALQPTVQLKNGPAVVAGVQPEGGGWQSAPQTPATPGFARYAGDTWVGRIASGSLTFLGEASLSISCADFYGHALDENPATVADWIDGWQGHESSAGADTQTTLAVVDAPPRVEGWEFR